MKKMKMIGATLALTAILAFPIAASAAATTGFGSVQPFAGTSTGQLIQAITRIVEALLGLAALIAAVFVVIGGVRYITSSGDEDAAAQGKNTVIYAVIGLVVIALSAVLVNFIIRNIT